jgi:tRNA A-37 threonylcarbamoyl transferase component Bud32
VEPGHYDDATLSVGPVSLPDADPDDLEARSIGHFAVLRRLGEGGMGVVYAAYDERLARRVAIKLLHGSDHLRMQREAQALARLSHPNVVQIYEIGHSRGRVFVAMEHVEGPTLGEWVSSGPRDLAAILTAFLQAGEGLLAAHACGLVHRDFKPHNVIVGDDGRARVLDFGLARAGDSLPDRADEHAVADLTVALLSPLTQAGALVGTPAYMSPEQHAALPVDARSDQFSFCAALYEALYGVRPFTGASLPELLANTRAGRLQPAPARSDVPPELHAALLRGLAVDPAARWPTLRPLLTAIAAGRRRSLAFGDRRAGRWIGIGTAAVSLAILVAVELLWERSDSVTLADNVRFALLTLLLNLAALPWLLRRFPHPRFRQLVFTGLLMMIASLVARVTLWRIDLSLTEAVVVETLVFAAIQSTAAVLLRLPWLLLTTGLLLGTLLCVLEFGASPYCLALAWTASIGLGVLVWGRSLPAE